MKAKIKKITVALFIFTILFSCAEEAPQETDSSIDYALYITYMDSLGNENPIPGAKVKMTSDTYQDGKGNLMSHEAESDEQGIASFSGLQVSGYNIYVNKEIITSVSTIIISGSKAVELPAERSGIDTLLVSRNKTSNIVINEIYYAGPVNNTHYFYDQYVELYNSSDMPIYLDGFILARAVQSQHPTMESNDFVQALYIFQFPGEPLEGKEYPINPGQFVVIAQDAIDHSKYIQNALDMSIADWEFYNPYGAEIDNPAPNVTNKNPERTTDFMINLVHNAIFLTDGSDWYYGETGDNEKQYIHFPIATVIDAVEYSKGADKQKEVTIRLDAGFAGINLQKYSGYSVQRIEPGYDTNNSTIDFENIKPPTPGYYK